MTSTEPSAGGRTQDALDVRAVLSEIETLRLAPEHHSGDLLTVLQSAEEELRVAGEELRVQQETIARLARSHRNLRLQQERTMSVLPVPVVVTDMAGVIRSANAAAARLVDMRVAHLIGKPLLALFCADDRPDLRRLVASSSRRSDGPLVRRTATLLPRAGQAVQVELTGSLELPGAVDGEISWVILNAQDLGDVARPIPETLAALVSLATGESDVTRVLPAAAAIAAGGLGSDVTISLGPPLEPTATASSSGLAQLCDGAQVTAGQGPSVDAHSSGRPVASPTIRTDHRWPDLGRRFPEEVASAVAAPILSSERVVGTLTAYAPTSSGSTQEAVGLLAVTFGGVLHELELHEQLDQVRRDMERALASRSVIDQAKGIVMATQGVDAAAAWDHLVRLSSTRHLKVRDLAEQIVRGTCPDA